MNARLAIPLTLPVKKAVNILKKPEREAEAT